MNSPLLRSAKMKSRTRESSDSPSLSLDKVEAVERNFSLESHQVLSTPFLEYVERFRYRRFSVFHLQSVPTTLSERKRRNPVPLILRLSSSFVQRRQACFFFLRSLSHPLLLLLARSPPAA
jgi:hypothetical protein